MFRCRRKNKTIAICLISFGLGMLLSIVIESFGVVVAIISIGFGAWLFTHC